MRRLFNAAFVFQSAGTEGRAAIQKLHLSSDLSKLFYQAGYYGVNPNAVLKASHIAGCRNNMWTDDLQDPDIHPCPHVVSPYLYDWQRGVMRRSDVIHHRAPDARIPAHMIVTRRWKIGV